MRLDAVSIFVKVVELKSLTAASDLLALPKSTISRRLAGLEKHLGVKLLHRTTRRMVLTEAGVSYYESCLKAVELIENANRAIREASEEPCGRLVVTAPHLFGTSFLMPVVKDYMQQYPKVEVTMELSQEPLDIVARKIDVAVRVGTINDPSLVARKVGMGGAKYYASPEYVSARGMPRSPSELATHDCIVQDTDQGPHRWPFVSSEGSVSVVVNSRLRINNFAMCYEAMLAGLGISRIPSFFAARDLALGRLVCVLEEWTPKPAPVSVVYSSRSHLVKRVRLFVELALDHLPSLLKQTLG